MKHFNRRVARTVGVALLACALVATGALSGCKVRDPLYCTNHEDCDNDVTRPYCDLTGTLPGSDGLKHTCVARPDPDAGPPDDGGGPDAAPMTAILSVAPTTQDFGVVVVGGQSGEQSFTVTNTGTESTGAITANLTGTNTGDFVATDNPCASTVLAPAVACVIRVRHSPTAAGLRSAAIDITANPGGTTRVTLTGAAAEPGALSLTPGDHPYGPVAIGRGRAPSRSRTLAESRPAHRPRW